MKNYKKVKVRVFYILQFFGYFNFIKIKINC